ncbi:MAG: hypothetical protein V3T41_10930 [bacterium]
MKNTIFIVLALTLAAGTAFGALGDVVASWPAPERIPLGLARGPDPSQMWVYCNEWPNLIYRVHSDTGLVYGSFFHYEAQNNVRGLSFSCGGPAPYSGNYLWVGDVLNRCVYMSDPATGRVYLSYSIASAPSGLAVEATGDGGLAPKAMFMDESVIGAHVYRLQLTTGSVLSSFLFDSPYIKDIAYDWRNNLVWATWARDGAVVGCDADTGSIAASFPSPPGTPYAFTYCGEYLWIGTTNYHYVYKVHCPADISVAPASLGRVKALFK